MACGSITAIMTFAFMWLPCLWLCLWCFCLLEGYQSSQQPWVISPQDCYPNCICQTPFPPKSAVMIVRVWACTDVYNVWPFSPLQCQKTPVFEELTVAGGCWNAARQLLGRVAHHVGLDPGGSRIFCAPFKLVCSGHTVDQNKCEVT